jgi:2-polyprenyl-3-methyl-5-hydroxy-6-metoxy-1,4-benzoquinol methylase
MLVLPVSPEPLSRDVVERTAERFARTTSSRSTYFYVASKLRSDPSTAAVLALAPLGDVLDLGSGRGQLSIALLEAGAATRVRGIDWDADKVAVARAASEALDASFEQADVRDLEVRQADTVLLVDVLHYFDAATQDAILARAAACVRPGGRLVVRDGTLGEGWRSALTIAAERIGRRLSVNKGERIVFRDVARELVPPLEAQGLVCVVSPCGQRTPFANVLLVATRAAST